VPCGVAPDGLPVALQIVGPKFADQRVLNAALAAEQAIGFRPLSKEMVIRNCNNFLEGHKSHAYA